MRSRRTSASRAAAAFRPVIQPAAFSPNVIGTACWSRVRPAIAVSRWRSASAAAAPAEAPRSSSRGPSARWATSIAAVSRMSWLVAPRWTSAAASGSTLSRTARTSGTTGLATRAASAPRRPASSSSAWQQPAMLSACGEPCTRASAASTSSMACSQAPSSTSARTAPRARIPSHSPGSDTGQPDVVLGQRRRARPRARDVAQLRGLELALERVLPGRAVQHRGHPPREVLDAPHPAQARLRVLLQGGVVAVLEPVDQGGGEHAHVGDRQVEALGAGRGHDVRGVAGQEQAPVLHRLDHDAAHRRDALLDDRALVERPAVRGSEAGAQLVPYPLVGPGLDLVGGVALQIEAAELRRAEAVQGEAAVVMAIDELVGRGRDLRKDSEPRERIVAGVDRQCAIGDGVAADSVRSVASGDDPAAQLLVGAVVAKADEGGVGVDGVDAHVLDLEEQRTACVQARLDEVLDHLLLPVDRDRPPAGQLGERDAVAAALEAQLEALVDEPLAVQALADAGLGEDVDRALLEDAGTDALLDVGAAAGLEQDGLNALAREQVAEEQAGRPGADDADVGLVRAGHAGTGDTDLSRTAPAPGTSSAAVIAMSTTSGMVQSPVASRIAPRSQGPVAAMR